MEKSYEYSKEAFASSFAMVANLGASILASSRLTAEHSPIQADAVRETPVSIERPQAPKPARPQIHTAA